MTLIEQQFARAHQERCARMQARAVPDVPIDLRRHRRPPNPTPPAVRKPNRSSPIVDDAGYRERLEKLLAPMPGLSTASKVSAIKAYIANVYRLSNGDIESGRRDDEVMLPRHIAMYLCHKLTDGSYPMLGRYFGDRHHTSILFAHEKIRAMRADNPEFDVTIAGYERSLTGIAALDGVR